MRQALRSRPGGEFAVPAGLHDEPLCRISYLRPVEGCPIYTEYFKEGDQVPGRLCPIHQGSDQAARAAGRRGVPLRAGQADRENLPLTPLHSLTLPTLANAKGGSRFSA